MRDAGDNGYARRRVLPIVIAVVAMSGLLALGGAVARGEQPGENLVLRLSDLPYGYEIGDGSRCGSLDAAGAPDPVASLAADHSPQGCWMDFERLYRTTYQGENPNFVVSMALLFDSAGAADEGLAIADEIAEHSFTGISGGVLREATDYSLDVPNPSRLFTSRDATGNGGNSNQGALIAWRSENVLAAVFIGGGFGERAVVDAANLFAARQQQRIGDPTPISPSELDDREVVLDSPHLNVPVYWLGRQFDPPGRRLPALSLVGGRGPLRSGESPGNRLIVEYETESGQRVSLGIWRRPAWNRQRRAALRRTVRSVSCTSRTTVDLRRGKAKIFGGYAAGVAGRRCPRGEPNRFFAHAKVFEATVVTVNMPDGLCCEHRSADGAGPYNSLRGMKKIVRGLKVRRQLDFREVG